MILHSDQSNNHHLLITTSLQNDSPVHHKAAPGAAPAKVTLSLVRTNPYAGLDEDEDG